MGVDTLYRTHQAILKRLLDDEGVSRQAVEANVQSLCQKLASALIQHQTQEARDVLRATNPSRGGEQQEEGEDDEEQSCFFQLHCLLRQLADSLSKAVEGAREQRLVVEEDQLTDLRNKLLDLEAQALMGQDSGGKQGTCHHTQSSTPAHLAMKAVAALPCTNPELTRCPANRLFYLPP